MTLYRESLLTMEQVAARFRITHHTVCAILKQELSPNELKRLKAVKYSESKTGDKNPQHCKRPPNFKGQCHDGHGYLTEIFHGKRYFVHQIVFADVLGISVENFPESVVVHHIDGDKTNNHLDNLALTTNRGHIAIHQRYIKSEIDYKMRKMTMAEAIKYLTSKLN